MLASDFLYMLLGLGMFGLWGYMFYVYFKNHKNKIELMAGILSLVLFIFLIIGISV